MVKLGLEIIADVLPFPRTASSAMRNPEGAPGQSTAMAISQSLRRSGRRIERSRCWPNIQSKLQPPKSSFFTRMRYSSAAVAVQTDDRQVLRMAGHHASQPSSKLELSGYGDHEFHWFAAHWAERCDFEGCFSSRSTLKDSNFAFMLVNSFFMASFFSPSDSFIMALSVSCSCLVNAAPVCKNSCLSF
mmetsp:Transcript_44479/g.100464  ORF Transcript_44479/g.100464 Transcript_44479/m.100464 type:complete len:188 (+) Transcript_44479:369-932(+)